MNSAMRKISFAIIWVEILAQLFLQLLFAMRSWHIHVCQLAHSHMPIQDD
jgi:hypothetical protein